MGKRGPPPKEKPPYRPQLRLSPEHRAQAEAMGTDELSRMVAWALPLWQSRREGEAIRPEFGAGTVILRPAAAKGLKVASVWYDESCKVLCCRRPVKDERFKGLIKAQGLSWNESEFRYERKMTLLTGVPVDRVAELAYLLYNAGYPVAVGSPALADRVQEGQWRPEQRRWVLALKSGDLLLTWEHGGDAVFKATEHLPDAKWSRDLQGTIVPARAGADVRDFAEQWNFALTREALGIIERAPSLKPEERLGIGLKEPNQPARKRHEKAELVEDQGEVIIPAHLRLEN